MTRIRVWDLPLRLFHGALAVAVVAAFVTEQAGNLDAHAVVGLTALGLLAFRVAWGFLGSTHARFTQFVRGPRAIRAYLRGEWHGIGHNPLGALSVLAMLLVLLLQAATGLFAHDDSTFAGPLAALVGSDTRDLLARMHRLQASVIIGLVLLHVAAIVYYARVKRENLVGPMLTGRKDVDEATASRAPAWRGGGPVAFVLSLAFSLGAVYVASGAWIPPPPPPEPVPAAMDW